MGLIQECLRVSFDDAGDGLEPTRTVGDSRLLVRVAKRCSERLGKLWSDIAGAGEMVECLAFIKAGHFDRPFDGRALAADLESRAALCDRNNPPVELWREALVDDQLFVTSVLAFLER